MEYIPLSLLEKIKQSLQTVGNNANPQMEVRAQKAAKYIMEANNLLANTVRTGNSLGPLDICIRREDQNLEPSEIIMVYIENGLAKLASKPYYTTPDKPFVYKYTIGPADDVACEFDGDWVRITNREDIYFDTSTLWAMVTFGEPYIITVNAGVLSVQQGQGESTILVDDGVSKCTIVRGWKDAYSWGAQDQGLVVAYIRNNIAMYRSYTQQINDMPALWETEHIITELPTPLQNLSAFRTNDYRIGFMAENNNIMNLIVTTRNWSSMAILPENIDLGLLDFYIILTGILYTDMFHNENVVLETILEISLLFAGDTIPLFVENLSSIVEQVSARLWSETNEYYTKWYPLITDSEAVYADDVLLIKDTDYTIDYSSGLITTDVVGQIKASYQWFSYGHKIKLITNYGLCNIVGNQSRFTIVDSLSTVFSVTGLEYGEEELDIPIGNYPIRDTIIYSNNFNEGIGSLTINYIFSAGLILGESGQEVNSFSINFNPTGLITPRVTIPPPIVGGIWNE
jgi:hypothetical protein